MNVKKIIVVGLIAEVAAFLVGNLLYMNPWSASIYATAGASYCPKPMEPFGGVGPWLMLMLAGGILSSILLTLLYSYTEKGFSIKPSWKKGLFFGFIFWLVAGLPNVYNTWLLHSYPDGMILMEGFSGLIGILVAGTVIGIMYEKIK